MTCCHCKCKIPDDSVFCPNCGIRVFTNTEMVDSAKKINSPSSDNSTPVDPHPETASSSIQNRSNASQSTATTSESNINNHCHKCGTTLAPNVTFCPNCGRRISTNARKKAPSKYISGQLKRRHAVTIAVIAMALVLVLIAGSVIRWSGTAGVPELYRSIKNTLDSQSFTISYRYQNGIDEGYGSIEVFFDPAQRELTLYVSENSITFPEHCPAIAIYNGYFIEKYGNHIYKSDINQILNELFNSYDCITESNLSNIDWERLLYAISGSRYTYEACCDTVNFDRVTRCLEGCFKNLSSEQWLSDNLDYSYQKSAGKTVHYFSSTLPRLLLTMLEEFQDAFLTNSSYSEVKNNLLDDCPDAEIRAEVSTSGEYLSTVSLIMTDKRSYEPMTWTGTFEFSKIGKTQIDTQQLSHWLTIAE